MFSRGNDNYKSSTLSIIGVGMDFNGEINTQGDVHIDGIVKGLVKAQEVVVGMDGDFDGEIICNSLKVNGKMSGKFVVATLHVCSDGLLEGKAKYDRITIDSGGKVQGELSINKTNVVKAGLHKVEKNENKTESKSE